MTRPVIAYLINQYPKVSHSFIRREILALERLGLEVQRWASRGWDADCPDEADRVEQRRTRYLMGGGGKVLAFALVRVGFDRPLALFKALMLAWQCSRCSERPWPVHLAYLAQACVALKWAQDSATTHVHAHFGTNPAEVAMLLAELGGPPFSFTVHGPEEFDKPSALHLAEKLQRATFTVAISSYGRSQLFRWAPASAWPKVKVVHCGLDAQFMQPAATTVPTGVRLVCVGRLCEQKGQLLLVQAAARLMGEGIHFGLVLAGDGEMRSEIETLVQQLGICAHVRITGWIGGEQVLAELQSARALVLPSFAEGLPVVIMEAMALGRPVISTYVAGIPELVVDGENGWLVPAGDVEALIDAMRTCLAASPERLEAFGNAGRQRVLQRHDIEREATKLALLFGFNPASDGGTAETFGLARTLPR
jgi:glycosyltransferase involved in cell wall biosynthesis